MSSCAEKGRSRHDANQQKYACQQTMIKSTTNGKYGLDAWFLTEQTTLKIRSYPAGLQNELWQRHDWVWGGRRRWFVDSESSSQMTHILCLWDIVGLMIDSWGVKVSPPTLSWERRRDRSPSLINTSTGGHLISITVCSHSRPHRLFSFSPAPINELIRNYANDP